MNSGDYKATRIQRTPMAEIRGGLKHILSIIVCTELFLWRLKRELKKGLEVESVKLRDRTGSFFNSDVLNRYFNLAIKKYFRQSQPFQNLSFCSEYVLDSPRSRFYTYKDPNPV